MKRGIALLLALVLALALVGCGGGNNEEASPSPSDSAAPSDAGTETPSDDAGEGKKLIGFSNASSDEYSTLIWNICEPYIQEHGYDAILTSADSSGEKQLSDIEDLITKGCDLIYIRAWDADAIIPAVEACVEAGIPTVIADYPVNTDKGSLYFTIDQTGYGVVQAEYLESLLEADPDLVLNICYLWGSFTFAPAQQRRDGVIETLRADGYMDDGRVVVLDEQSIEMDGSKVMSKCEDWLTRFPDANCFIGANDDIAYGIGSTLKAAGYQINKDAWVLGIEGTEVGLNGIQEETISATVTFDLVTRSHDMLDYVFRILEGEDFGGENITIEGVGKIVTAENVADYL